VALLPIITVVNMSTPSQSTTKCGSNNRFTCPTGVSHDANRGIRGTVLEEDLLGRR
jgi:hypothetical protein